MHVGLFRDTLEPFLETLDGQRLVIHLDADLYASTLYCLVCLRSRLRTGDVLIFDDFTLGHIDTEFRAFQDFVATFGLKYTVDGYSAGFIQCAMVVD